MKSGALDVFILSIAEETQINTNSTHGIDAINEGVPIVLFDRVADEMECDKVIVNDFEGARHATDYLIKTACKKIELVSVIHTLSVGKLIVAGYKKT